MGCQEEGRGQLSFGQNGDWWNGEVKVAKATRESLWDIETLQVDANQCSVEVVDAADEFKQDLERLSFINELCIMNNRAKALDLVMSSNAKELQTYIANFTANSAQDGAVPVPESASASSRDMSHLALVGPCPNFRQLKTFTELRVACKFDNCTNDEEIKASIVMLAQGECSVQGKVCTDRQRLG